jgi:cytoplasmic iron level regulating protein YaaA (DUF328/UPF0246 family)
MEECFMKKIVLISCAKKQQKKGRFYKAEDLYISPFFKKCLEYARTLTGDDKVFVLSPKHGLVKLEQELEPYDVSLKGMSGTERGAWDERILDELKKACDLDTDYFILLASDNYTENIEPHLKNKETPMKGLRIGEKLKWLNERLERGIK